MGLIYRIQNKHDGKSYVGKTEQSLKSRLRRHKAEMTRGTNRPLYNSWRKHGFDHFEVVILEEVDNNLLIEREQFWIKQENCIHPHGYNFTAGGEGGNVKQFWTVEEKAKLHAQQAARRLGQKRTPQQRENISRGARLREATKSSEQKVAISTKISKRLLELGRRPPVTIRRGPDHHGYISVDLDVVMKMIKLGYRLKDVASQYDTNNQVIWQRLKQTGKTYKEWRQFYGVSGTYRRLGPNQRFERQEV